MRDRRVAGVAIGLWGFGSAIALSGFTMVFWVWPALAIAWGVIYAWRRLSFRLALIQILTVIAGTVLMFAAVPMGVRFSPLDAFFPGTAYACMFFGLWMIPVGVIAHFIAQERPGTSTGPGG